MYMGGNRSAREMLEEIRSGYGALVFKTVIRRGVAVSDAAAAGQDISHTATEAMPHSTIQICAMKLLIRRKNKMAKSERRQAIAPIVDDIDVTEEIREINNPLLQPEKKEEIDRYTILLPKSKFKRIRMAAVMKEVPIKAIFEEMLDEYLERHNL